MKIFVSIINIFWNCLKKKSQRTFCWNLFFLLHSTLRSASKKKKKTLSYGRRSFHGFRTASKTQGTPSVLHTHKYTHQHTHTYTYTYVLYVFPYTTDQSLWVFNYGRLTQPGANASPTWMDGPFRGAREGRHTGWTAILTFLYVSSCIVFYMFAYVGRRYWRYLWCLLWDLYFPPEELTRLYVMSLN